MTLVSSGSIYYHATRAGINADSFSFVHGRCWTKTINSSPNSKACLRSKFLRVQGFNFFYLAVKFSRLCCQRISNNSFFLNNRCYIIYCSHIKIIIPTIISCKYVVRMLKGNPHAKRHLSIFLTTNSMLLVLILNCCLASFGISKLIQGSND